MERVMHMEVSFAEASDRVIAALVQGLQIEFGRGAGEALAQRFLDAEDADFCWDARLQERWLGCYECREDGWIELDRVAILGKLDGRWFAATMLVDGEGRAHGMLGKRAFANRAAAEQAYRDAR